MTDKQERIAAKIRKLLAIAESRYEAFSEGKTDGAKTNVQVTRSKKIES